MKKLLKLLIPFLFIVGYASVYGQTASFGPSGICEYALLFAPAIHKQIINIKNLFFTIWID
ncbi:hypothetical protein ACR79S_18700 [Sphingobacterium spiritivorum]|uniref:hypothetical protein n=1 Tax=Sphingobacterium spiritivorum TaxID=258 RepID=UPI003DA2887E